MVQRRVRQHHAELGGARRDGGGDGRVRQPGREDDRALHAGEGALGVRGEVDEFTRRVEVAGHQRERLLLAPLATAQRGDRALVGRAAREVIAADSLHRDHETRREGQGRGMHGVGRVATRIAARRVDEPRRRAAFGAGVRLRVEAPVARIVVLRLTAAAHDEAGHRGLRPVVGDAADDREAGPAVRAVDERVAVAAVGRVEQLGEAGVAGRGVGRHACGRRSAAARGDREASLTGRREIAGGHRLHAREGRRLGRQASEEPLHVAGVALDFDRHAARVVEDEARESELGCEAMDVGPEADTLNDPVDPHAGPAAQRGRAHPGLSTSSRSTCHALACASWMRGMCSDRVTTTWSASASEAIRPPS